MGLATLKLRGMSKQDHELLSARKTLLKLIRLAVTYVVLLRVVRIMNSPESQICKSVGHAQDRENRIFQTLLWIRDRSAKI